MKYLLLIFIVAIVIILNYEPSPYNVLLIQSPCKVTQVVREGKQVYIACGGDLRSVETESVCWEYIPADSFSTVDITSTRCTKRIR